MNDAKDIYLSDGKRNFVIKKNQIYFVKTLNQKERKFMMKKN